MATELTTPKKILDKLSAGVAVEDCGMPTPSTGQTLICKTAIAGSIYLTIHTVTAGKTFYLMGVTVCCTTALTNVWSLSFDGGTTVHLALSSDEKSAAANNNVVLHTGYPIAQISAGSVIQAKTLGDDPNMRITIWGWEE